MPIHPCPPTGYSIKCEYSAHKEGVLKEEMLLACEGDIGTCVRVTVQARVMGELGLGQVWLEEGDMRPASIDSCSWQGLSPNPQLMPGRGPCGINLVWCQHAASTL